MFYGVVGVGVVGIVVVRVGGGVFVVIYDDGFVWLVGGKG